MRGQPGPFAAAAPGRRRAPRPCRGRPGERAEVEDAAGAAARRDAVLAALGRLPERQREVLVLRHYLDLSEAEIAATLGISRGAVKSHAHRGSTALREHLADYWEDPA